MKVLLIILCAIMLLFSGGCVIFLGGSVGGLSLIPLGVAVLNGFALAAIFGWAKATRAVFYILVVLDAIAVVGLSVAWAAYGANDPTIVPWGLLLIGGFALKGLLTWLHVKSVAT
jgi:hypothetical protein